MDTLAPCEAAPEHGALRGAGREAEELEAALGIPVLRHGQKKPAGNAAEAEAHFGCALGLPCAHSLGCRSMVSPVPCGSVARLLRARFACDWSCIDVVLCQQLGSWASMS